MLKGDSERRSDQTVGEEEGEVRKKESRNKKLADPPLLPEEANQRAPMLSVSAKPDRARPSRAEVIARYN